MLHEACPETKAVLITGHGSVRTAVTALKRGAVEYMAKPIKPRRLLALIRALTQDPPAYLTNRMLANDRIEAQSFDGMHARSRQMLQVFEKIRVAAQSDTTVLIVGESGTGKELVARAIHQRSPVGEGPFVAVHTGAIPQELIASELFGHEKGAFTGAVDKKPGKFELAEGGTLFLDEISTMDERTQINLLRVLETHAYTRVGGKKERDANVRVLAASNRDLESMVKAGQFREDLYYRLNIFPVKLPPLRERSEDIPVIAGEFVREFARKYGKTVAQHAGRDAAAARQLQLAGQRARAAQRHRAGGAAGARRRARAAAAAADAASRAAARGHHQDPDRHGDGRHRARGHLAHAGGQRGQQDRDRRGARDQPAQHLQQAGALRRSPPATKKRATPPSSSLAPARRNSRYRVAITYDLHGVARV